MAIRALRMPKRTFVHKNGRRMKLRVAPTNCIVLMIKRLE